MISSEQLADIERRWLHDESSQQSRTANDVAILINEARTLREICRQIVEADDSDSDGNALMSMSAIAEEIRNGLELQS